VFHTLLKISVIAIVLLFACRPDKNKFSPVPFLQIKGAYVYNNGFDKDSFIELVMHYRDGDGDIGLDPGDTVPPFNYGGEAFYNLKIWMWEKVNGKWIKPINLLASPPDTMNFHERIPRITPSGRAKWIEGDLSVKIPAEPYGLKPDTVKLQVMLMDRSLQSSGWLESEELILKH
jgi:hypothetical protein